MNAIFLVRGLIVFGAVSQCFAQDPLPPLPPLPQDQPVAAPATAQPPAMPIDQAVVQPVAPQPVDASQVAASQPAPAPVVPAPDATVQAQSPVAAQPVAGAPVEQLGWPDTIQVAEDGQAQAASPVVGQMFKNAEEKIQKAGLVVQELTKKREALHTQFFELDARLDEFFQNTTFALGKVHDAPAGVEGSGDLTRANEIVRDIGVGKDALKGFLTKMNDALQLVKELVLQSRQKSLDILKQNTEDAAKGLMQAIDGLVEQVTKQSQEIEGAIVGAFAAQLTQVNDMIVKVQPILASLQAKSFVAKAKEEQAAVMENLKEQQQESKRTFKSWFIPDEKEEKGGRKAGEEQTFIHYLLARLADLITEILRVLYNLMQSVKNWVMPAQEASSGQPQAVSASQATGAPGAAQQPQAPVPAMPAPQMPVTPQAEAAGNPLTP